MNLIELGLKIGVDGFLHCNELAKLVELAAGRDVLEIGSYRGLSAWGMAISAKTLTCIDTFKSATNGQRQTDGFTTMEAFENATRRFTNVRSFVGLSSEVKIIGDFDMIFLDATHTFEEVKADIERWWPRLRPGGVFAMHDYGHSAFEGVKLAADEFFGPAPEGTTLVTLRWVDKRE